MTTTRRLRLVATLSGLASLSVVVAGLAGAPLHRDGVVFAGVLVAVSASVLAILRPRRRL